MSVTQNLSDHLSVNAVKNIEAWLSQSKYAQYRDELIAMIDAGRWQELEDAFFKVIEFGTAGRRGVTGIGSNRINRVTIGESAQALCEYAKSFDQSAPEKGVVIAYDTRLSSPELSRYAAQVCAANGFKTYLFDSYRSTPELSFAVRHLNAAVGIVISASHNPPRDNGFKAYWSDGAQLVAPHDAGVLAAATSITDIHSIDFEEAIESGILTLINDDIDEKYISAIANEAEGTERELKIVYSPLHGAGQTNVLPSLRRVSFDDVSVVEAQMSPDGNFPTVQGGKSNPEDKIANELAVRQMLETQADIAITNDPDADRVGIMARENDQAVYFTGNQAAILAADYVLRKKREKGTLTPKHYLAKTIVTTDMINALAAHYGVTVYGNMLVGFKYIGELIRSKEGTDEVFLTGSEESFGLLKGTYARDKDGATGALPIAEYAAELKKEGKTLVDRLYELYAQHGLYLERVDNPYFEGAKGFETMQSVMNDLRTNPITALGGYSVSALLDYQSSERRELTTGQITPIDCAKGNVVVLEFNNDSRCRVTIRPSGTEPKLKFYVQWYEAVSDPGDVRKQYDATHEMLAQLSKQLESLLLK